jgi:hypothetical protein
MPGLERAADRRREQHWHVLGLPLVPSRDEATGVFEDLSLGSALCSSFLFGGCCALCLHPALVESHGADFAAAGRRESSRHQGRGAAADGSELRQAAEPVAAADVVSMWII